MRKPNSITNLVFTRINSLNVGETFTVSELYEHSMQCDSKYGPRQRVYDILCMLNKTGLISRVKRGTYRLDYPIPEELTFTDVESYCGYTSYISFNPINGTVLSKRKRAPFDIDAYKNKIDSESAETPSLDAEPELKTIYCYIGDGEYVTQEVPSYSKAHLADPHKFSHLLDLFGVYPDAQDVTGVEESSVDQEQLDEINNDIANEFYDEAETEEFKVEIEDPCPEQQVVHSGAGTVETNSEVKTGMKDPGLEKLAEEITSPRVGQKIYYIDSYNRGFSIDEHIIDEVITRESKTGTVIEIITNTEELYRAGDPEVCFTRSEALERVRKLLS